MHNKIFVSVLTLIVLISAFVINPVPAERLSGVRSIRNLRDYLAARASGKQEQDTDDSSASVSFANSCQCGCCYQVGDHSECVSPTVTTFDVATCQECNVGKCETKYPISCNAPSSEVNTTCIVRKGWILRVLPTAFLIALAGLLVYGCFIKGYDGYHPAPQRPSSAGQAVAAAGKGPEYQAVASTS